MTIHLIGENGVPLYFAGTVLPEGIAERVERGDLTRVSEDGTPWDDGTPDVDDAAAPPDVAPLPSGRAARAAWAEYAVSQGMDPDDAARHTKAELIGLLSSLREAG